jgi:hypothetical protein
MAMPPFSQYNALSGICKQKVVDFGLQYVISEKFPAKRAIRAENLNG